MSTLIINACKRLYFFTISTFIIFGHLAHLRPIPDWEFHTDKPYCRQHVQLFSDV